MSKESKTQIVQKSILAVPGIALLLSLLAYHLLWRTAGPTGDNYGISTGLYLPGMPLPDTKGDPLRDPAVSLLYRLTYAAYAVLFGTLCAIGQTTVRSRSKRRLLVAGLAASMAPAALNDVASALGLWQMPHWFGDAGWSLWIVCNIFLPLSLAGLAAQLVLARWQSRGGFPGAPLGAAVTQTRPSKS